MMRFLGSGSRRMTSDGTPIWYVFIDESGRPYFDAKDSGPFAIAALITDDPELLASIALSQRSNSRASWKYRNEPGRAELKHSRSSVTVANAVLQQIQDSGCIVYATFQPMRSEYDNPVEGGAVTYMGNLSRILLKIAEQGPKGLYRIRLDNSRYMDQELAELIARSAFDGMDGRELAAERPVAMIDSDLEPAIQVADMMVGAYRDSLKEGDEGFVERNKVNLANRKRRYGRWRR